MYYGEPRPVHPSQVATSSQKIKRDLNSHSLSQQPRSTTDCDSKRDCSLPGSFPAPSGNFGSLISLQRRPEVVAESWQEVLTEANLSF